MKKMNVWILGHSTLLLEILYALLQEVALGALLPDWGNVLLNAVQSVLAERFLDAIAKQLEKITHQAKEIMINRRDVRRARHRKS
ncbi:hypothetical protein LF909_08395 [Bifidobacterium pseudolongum]|uniref:hypothetical protein n=1 Tax=Bifidobacterium pseudolongum TaxID=1694 RepID=UPI001F0D33A9|nr:hypothetical protein [Bifidobacterium pseudolongum]MCH4853935.1 hypothetical protein [Bifidobacterium pseudolongum]